MPLHNWIKYNEILNVNRSDTPKTPLTAFKILVGNNALRLASDHSIFWQNPFKFDEMRARLSYLRFIIFVWRIKFADQKSPPLSYLRYIILVFTYRGIANKNPPLKVQKPEIGEGVFIILKIWFPKKLRGVFIILKFFSDSTFLAYFLEHKKTPNFSISPLRNPFLVPKIPQNFRRRFAPIRGVFIILKIWAPKKLRGVFIILKILQKMSRGFLIEGGGLLLIPR